MFQFDLKLSQFLFRLQEDQDNFFHIGLKTQMNLKVFLHEEDEEFWLKVGNFPFKVASAKLDIKNEDGLLV